MINAALKDTATVAVCSHSDTILTDGIKYELKLHPRVTIVSTRDQVANIPCSLLSSSDSNIFE